MWRRLVAVVLVVVAWPSTAGAANWVPGFDEIAPAGIVREPVAVVTPDLRTVVTWVDGLTVRAAIRPRGGTFGEPFLVDAGSGTYVPSFLDAVALPNGEVLVAWGGPTEVHDVRVRTVKPDGTVAVARPDVFGGISAIGANAAGSRRRLLRRHGTAARGAAGGVRDVRSAGLPAVPRHERKDR